MQTHTMTEAIIECLAWMLIHSTWQVCLIGLVLFSILRLVNTKDHRVKYWSSISALFIATLSAAATFVFYLSSVNIQPEVIVLMEQANNEVVFPNSQTAQLPFYTKFYQSIFDYNDFIVLLWLIGAAVLFIKFCLGLLTTLRIKQSLIPIDDTSILAIAKQVQAQLGLHSNYSICSSTKTNSAAVFGWLKPIIILPICMLNALSEKELELILAHEMAHIKRYDFIFNILQSVAEIILYYHPVIWWISRVINEEREICCDEVAVRETDLQISYARTLIKLQELNLAQVESSLIHFSGKNNQFKNRILNILNQPINTDIKMERLIAFFGILIISLSFTTLSYTKDLIIELCADYTPVELKAPISFASDEANSMSHTLPIATANQPQLLHPLATIAQTSIDTLPVKHKKVIVIEMDEEDASTEKIIKEVRIALDNEQNKENNIDKNLFDVESSKVTILTDKEDGNHMTIVMKNFEENQDLLKEKVEQSLLDANEAEAKIIDKAMQNMTFHIDEDELTNSITIDMENLASDMEAMAEELTQKHTFLIEKIQDKQGLWDLGDLDIEIDNWDTDDLTGEFETQLIEDGLIDDPNKYMFELKYKSLRINGKEMPTEILYKYKAHYETFAGNKLKRRSKVIIHKKNGKRKSEYNNISISG